MQNRDQGDWANTLAKTQKYLSNRISGIACDRDLVGAWRYFYQTHQPVVRLLVSKSGIAGSLITQCTEEVWIEILRSLPTLKPPQTYDSFFFWLSQIVRGKTMQRSFAVVEQDCGEDLQHELMKKILAVLIRMDT